LRHLEIRLEARSERGRESLWHLHVDADLVQVGDFEQLLPAFPALISAPRSVLRAVTTPSNGAMML